jgi:hypothetical protein
LLPPPQEDNATPKGSRQSSANPQRICGQSPCNRFRFRRKNHPKPGTIAIQVIGIAPGGRMTEGTAPMVAGAVVPSVTVTVCGAPPLTDTDVLDKVHVGGGLTTGLTLQVRLTVPVSEPDGATTKLNFALCPALMVWEVGEPEAAPTLKSGAATATPDRATVCGLPAALSVIVMLPARLPEAVGWNVTETWQLLPGANPVLQVFVSPKSPEAEMFVMFSIVLPMLATFMTWAELVVPTTCELNASGFGFSLGIGPSPVLQNG